MDSPCIEYPGHRSKRGYGRNNRGLVHRQVWAKHNGPVPPGLEICHACDNPSCINPAHLFAATHHQNMLDASSKGRLGRKVHYRMPNLEQLTYSLPEAAQSVGVSVWLLRKHIKQGKLRPTRLGRLIRITEKELRRYVEANTRKAT